jgi:signal transduction histidine kinase
MVDVDRTLQTLTNLISNAVKFSHPGPSAAPSWSSTAARINVHSTPGQNSVFTFTMPRSMN